MFETHLTTDPRGAIFIDADAYTDPEAWHRTAAELRSEAPVLRVEADGYLPFWALTRHADVFEVSRRSDVFFNTEKSAPGPSSHIIWRQPSSMLLMGPSQPGHSFWPNSPHWPKAPCAWPDCESWLASLLEHTSASCQRPVGRQPTNGAV